MMLQALPTIPKWVPKERMAPLKEEYLQFHWEVTQFHDHVEGYLLDKPDLANLIADVPEALNNFTNKMAIVLTAGDLQPYLSDLQSAFDKVCQR